MTYQLRGYQVEAADAAMRGFQKGKPFIIQAATAAGKSLIIAEIAKRLGGKPLLVLQPNKEILQQNHEKMVSYGLEDVKMYSASVNSKEIGKITLATIGSIYKKPNEFAHFEYAVLDECHQYNAKGKSSMYNQLFKVTNIRNVCGLTATPFRLDNKYFDGGDTYTGCLKMLNRMTKDSFFRNIEYKIEMAELVAAGYLTQPIYHTTDIDLQGLVVNTTGRDYTEASLETWGAKRATKFRAIVGGLANKHKRILTFATSVAQATSLSSDLRELGINSAVVSADTPKKEREALLSAFREGEIKCMLNVGVLTTGFDMPVLDCVVLLRPTFSVALYMQIVGRGMRLDPDDPDKEFHFYDLTNTAQKFGRVETIRVVKEDGFKDMLQSEVGRLDNVELFRFDRTTNTFTEGKLGLEKQTTLPFKHPEDPDIKYLLSLV